jgi:hypothetical protein
MKKHILLLLALCGVQIHAGKLLTTTKSAAANLEDQKNKSDQNHKQEIDTIRRQHAEALVKQQQEYEQALKKYKEELAQ